MLKSNCSMVGIFSVSPPAYLHNRISASTPIIENNSGNAENSGTLCNGGIRLSK